MLPAQTGTSLFPFSPLAKLPYPTVPDCCQGQGDPSPQAHLVHFYHPFISQQGQQHFIAPRLKTSLYVNQNVPNCHIAEMQMRCGLFSHFPLFPTDGSRELPSQYSPCPSGVLKRLWAAPLPVYQQELTVGYLLSWASGHRAYKNKKWNRQECWES